jgi:hypothetical protein
LWNWKIQIAGNTTDLGQKTFILAHFDGFVMLFNDKFWLLCFLCCNPLQPQTLYGVLQKLWSDKNGGIPFDLRSNPDFLLLLLSKEQVSETQNMVEAEVWV